MNQPLSVKDVYLLHGTASVVADEEVTLERLINIYATNPAVRGVFLVDTEKRFAGMVSRLAIQKWAEYQLFGKWKNKGDFSAVSDLVGGIKARELAHGGWPATGLRETNRLEDAFVRMMDIGEDILPVVDDEGHVIGDLRLSEILLKAVEAGHEQTSDNKA
jgi:CBS domain-containing protein